MTSQPIFVRLVEGRLWHLQDGQLLTACGRQVEGDRQPERLVGAVPSGAWVCLRCRATRADWLHAVDQAIRADPRTRRTDPLPDADAIDAEPTDPERTDHA